MQGWSKIKQFCARARADLHDRAWIDTCCIDKSSSAELSEAINSMFSYYRDSKICYAYLSDVSLKAQRTSGERADAENSYDVTIYDSFGIGDLFGLATARQFKRSKWFTRGWTLQELIAPKNIAFLDRDWCNLGSRKQLDPAIASITNIEPGVCDSASKLKRVSVAEKMSWAAGRQTTRERTWPILCWVYSR